MYGERVQPALKAMNFVSTYVAIFPLRSSDAQRTKLHEYS